MYIAPVSLNSKVVLTKVGLFQMQFYDNTYAGFLQPAQ